MIKLISKAYFNRLKKQYPNNVTEVVNLGTKQINQSIIFYKLGFEVCYISK